MTPKQSRGESLSARARAALVAGLGARAASKAMGRGAGGMFGGRVALRVNPEMIEELSAGKRCVLITGTNGKSTTTKMVAAALSAVGRVAGNLGGDNMQTGVTTALMVGRDAHLAALEVDEMNMPDIAGKVRPEAIVLLNLSRDQLDRVGEIGAVEKRLRDAVNANPQATIIANCDDPLVVSAAWDAPKVIWVAAGAPWKDDAVSFPRTGTLIERHGEDWEVEGDGAYRRPAPDWEITEVFEDGSFDLLGPDGTHTRVSLSVPGRANRGNSAQAIAAAVVMGVAPLRAARAVESVSGVAGRYQTYDVAGRAVNLLLAKNPAGWQESQTSIPSRTEQVIVAVNAQRADGTDTSWLWDVDFTPLRELGARRIIASGERAADLAVRLDYAGITAEVIDSPFDAIFAMDVGPVQVLANYTAFRDLKKEIEAARAKSRSGGDSDV